MAQFGSSEGERRLKRRERARPRRRNKERYDRQGEARLCFKCKLGSGPWSRIAKKQKKYYRGVAQFGRALGSGPKGRWFKSSHSDTKRRGVCLVFLYRNGFIPLFQTIRFIRVLSRAQFGSSEGERRLKRRKRARPRRRNKERCDRQGEARLCFKSKLDSGPENRLHPSIFSYPLSSHVRIEEQFLSAFAGGKGDQSLPYKKPDA